MKISKEIVSIIEDRITEYEKMYGIQVLLWSFRGSMDVGIYRKNSDLDIIFIYRSVNKKIRAIHDIVGHGFDYWGWLLDDVITTVDESNKICDSGEVYVMSKEHERGSLDYYFGVYCSLDNELASVSKDFTKYMDYVRELCISKSVIIWFNKKLEKTCKKIVEQRKITGNEYLYSVWYALMCKHIMLDNKTGDNKLRKLMDLYASLEEREEIIKIHNDYKTSESKTAKIYFNHILNELLMQQHECNKKYILESGVCIRNQEYEKAKKMLRKFATFEII